MGVFRKLAIADILSAEMQDIKDSLEDIGITLHGIVVQKLSQPGSGEMYMSSRGGAQHQASAPGEPPAVDTGVYRGSWQWEMVDDNAIDIFTSDDRGPALEYGTSSIEPRPHLRPSVEELIPKIEGIVKGRVNSGSGTTFSGGDLGGGSAGEITDDMNIGM